MRRTERIRPPSVLGALDTPHQAVGAGLKSGSTMLSWTETEHEALLQVIPDQVFRLKLQDDGSVSVIGDRCGFRFTASVLDNPECNPVTEDKTEDQTSCLCRELARQAKGIIDESSRSGPVQIFEVQIDQRGQIRRYEGRAAAAAPAEIVALVTEITSCEEAELGVSGSGRVETSPDSILRQQVSQYAGDEEVIRDVSIKLNRLLEDTIKAIQSVVQKKDPSTARHQARVWKLACAIGREMGLGKTRVAIIGLAAMVHDFGKVFIPADILNKPGKLTEAEYEAVKNHAEAVFQILSTIDVFCPIADIVRQHHERMNGSGYPLGLKGDDILLEARIIAVADVVEAMLSDRPYRRALGVEAAMKEIAGGRGTLYDANAVDACIRLFKDGGFDFDQENVSVLRKTSPPSR